MLESTYQNKLIKKLEQLFPGCVIVKNDPSHKQGFPDLTIFYKDHWAVLEVKASAGAPQQPNQEYFVGTMGQMSFAAFIYPENEREVLSDLQSAFSDHRKARVS